MDPQLTPPPPDAPAPPDTRPSEQTNDAKWSFQLIRNNNSPTSEPPLLTATKVIFLASVVVIPCITLRKLAVLQKKVTDLHGMSIGQHHHLKSLSHIVAASRAENARLISLLEETREEARALRAESRALHAAQGKMEDRLTTSLTDNKRELDKLTSHIVQSDAARMEAAKRLGEKLKVALRENDRTKVDPATFKELGTGLADVAAFMHEIELLGGYAPRTDDGRRIERIRQLAHKLESTSGGKGPAKDKDASSGTSSRS